MTKAWSSATARWGGQRQGGGWGSRRGCGGAWAAGNQLAEWCDDGMVLDSVSASARKREKAKQRHTSDRAEERHWCKCSGV